ncbi:MAG: hypothetical protein Q8N36_05845 [bacterium]|nr:hypothetical protein [bacterium]
MKKRRNKFLVLGVATLLMAMLMSSFAQAAVNEAGTTGVGLGKSMGGLVTSVSRFLGIDVATIQEARRTGVSFSQQIVTAGKSTDAFIAEETALRQAKIAELVASGVLTAEKAALCVDTMPTKLLDRLNSTQLKTAGQKNMGVRKGHKMGR